MRAFYSTWSTFPTSVSVSSVSKFGKGCNGNLFSCPSYFSRVLVLSAVELYHSRSPLLSSSESESGPGPLKRLVPGKFLSNVLHVLFGLFLSRIARNRIHHPRGISTSLRRNVVQMCPSVYLPVEKVFCSLTSWDGGYRKVYIWRQSCIGLLYLPNGSQCSCSQRHAWLPGLSTGLVAWLVWDTCVPVKELFCNTDWLAHWIVDCTKWSSWPLLFQPQKYSSVGQILLLHRCELVTRYGLSAIWDIRLIVKVTMRPGPLSEGASQTQSWSSCQPQ